MSKKVQAQEHDETLTREEEEIYLLGITGLGDNLAYACLHSTHKVYPTKPQIVALQLSRDAESPSASSSGVSSPQMSRAPSLAKSGSTVSGSSMQSLAAVLEDFDSSHEVHSDLAPRSLRSSILHDDLKGARLVVREHPHVNLNRVNRPVSMAYTPSAYWRMSGVDQSHLTALDATRLWERSKRAGKLAGKTKKVPQSTPQVRHSAYAQSSWGIITPEDSVSNVNLKQGSGADLFDFELPEFCSDRSRRSVAV